MTQRPIPIWFGGGADTVLQRVGRLGDGWFPLVGAGDKCRGMIAAIHGHARAAGRDPKSIGIEGRIALGQGSVETWLQEIQAWKDLGATHLTLNTMKAGLANPSAHIEAIRRFKDATAQSW